MIEKSIYYSIADLQLELTMPSDWDVSQILPNFEPFKESKVQDSPISCRVLISGVDLDFDKSKAKLLSDISIVWGDRFTFYETEEYYWTLIQYSKEKDKFWKMRSSKDFTCNTIYCGKLAQEKNNFISWYCMVAFAQSALLHKCVLIHASVVMNKEFGYAFLGRSGTGKSTHSRLWLRYNEGFTLLNDDNPAVRIKGDVVYVYGTPWSGKTQCYVNDFRKLGGLVRLKQAPENNFQWMRNKEALLTLLPSCSAIRWNNSLYSSLVNILIEIVSITPIAAMECLPDEDAAKLCYNKLMNL